MRNASQNAYHLPRRHGCQAAQKDENSDCLAPWSACETLPYTMPGDGHSCCVWMPTWGPHRSPNRDKGPSGEIAGFPRGSDWLRFDKWGCLGSGRTVAPFQMLRVRRRWQFALPSCHWDGVGQQRQRAACEAGILKSRETGHFWLSLEGSSEGQSAFAS